MPLRQLKFNLKRPEIGSYQSMICLDDNCRGYESDNVASCCKMCQNAKRDYTVLEFLGWVKRISDFQRLIKNSV